MIVHYDKSKLFDFKRSDENIFLFGFPSLFAYDSLFLEEIYTKWPKVKDEIKFLEKKIRTQECMMIFHSKHGTLILILYSLFPKVTDREKKGQIVTIQAKKEDVSSFIFLCINSINIEGVIRVSMSSFASSLMSKQELLTFFAEHKRPFELYY